MLKVDRIVIDEFRGLRHIDINLEGQNHVIVGPNGSGKSGVVDAIDFALTGEIRRLSGTGSGELSIAKHGPHVSAKGKPATVSLTIQDVASKATATLTRSIATRSTYTLTPDDASIRSAIDDLALHQEITLSRREILRFVMAQASNRAQDVATLLNLDKLREVGRQLQTASNALRKDAGNATDDVAREWTLLYGLLGLAGGPTPAKVIDAINSHRNILDMPPLAVVESTTKVGPEVGSSTSQSTFNKESAAGLIASLQDKCNEGDSNASGDLVSAVKPFQDDPKLLALADLADFYSSGLARLMDEHCPLCGIEWDSIESLQTHIQEKVDASIDAVTYRGNLISASAQAVSAVKDISSAISPALAIAKSLGLEQVASDLQEWTTDLAARVTALTEPSTTVAIQFDSLPDLKLLTEERTRILEILSAAIIKQPEQDPKDAARALLIGVQLGLDRLNYAEARSDSAALASKVATQLFNSYNKVQEGALSKLYEEVESDFSAYYRSLNSDDESEFTAKFTPSGSGLGLEVDFYKHDPYPPGALHSEGHQDSMGVCLYLALMRKVLGAELGLIVLDDVVMSVDTDHRRRLAELLKCEFSDVQFVMTTHDKVWAHQMRTVGLIASHSETKFWGWTVDTGPVTSDGSEFWDLIDAEIKQDEINAAAARLRRNLEATLSDLTVSLRGRVRFKSDGNYDLGDFISAVQQRYGQLLAKALKAAKSYNQTAKVIEVETKQASFRASDASKSAEHSAVNPAVHYNDWENYSAADFEPVVAAWRSYLDALRCGKCETYVGVEATASSDGFLKCKCGDWNLNLTSK